VAAALYLFANAGFRDLVRRTREKRRLEETLRDFRSERLELAREWTLIQRNPAYTEYLIRRHLGYGKKGEVEYRLLPAQAKKKTP
jgi:hypothetical protein